MPSAALQTVFSALAVEPEVYSSDDEGPVGAAGGAAAAARRDTSADALGRLVFEVFQRDVRAFRWGEQRSRESSGGISGVPVVQALSA